MNSDSKFTQASSDTNQVHSTLISAVPESNPTSKHPTEPPLHPTELALVNQNHHFPTYDAAEAFLWELAIENGHGITKRRSKDPFVDSDGVKRHRRVQFHCERSGDPADDKNRHARRQSPKKSADLKAFARCGCPWRAVCHFSRVHSRWAVAILEESHNHKPSQHPELSNAYRRFLRANQEKAMGISLLQKVADLKEAGLTLGNIAATLSTAQTPILREDVKTIVRALRRSTYGPYSATQIFLRQLRDLEKTGDVFLRMEHHPETERIHRIFWAYKDSIELFKKNPEVLSFDNTYKVNRFNMPLMQIGGITGLHTNFSIGFALTSREDEDTFCWTLSQLKELADHYKIPSPLVIISDYDQAFKNAACSVFGSSQQQLCVWHILKNVVHNIKQKWEGPLGDFAGGVTENARISGLRTSSNNLAAFDDLDEDENANEEDPGVQVTVEKSLDSTESMENAHISPNGLLQSFRSMLYMDSVEGFEKAWEALKEKFGTQTGLFAMLNYNFQSLISFSYPLVSRSNLYPKTYGMGEGIYQGIS